MIADPVSDVEPLFKACWEILNAYRADGVMGMMSRSGFTDSLREGRLHLEYAADGRLLGFMQVSVKTRLERFSIDRLVVRQSELRKGVGTRFVDTAKRLASEKGLVLRLRVDNRNTNALAFFRTYEFVEVEVSASTTAMETGYAHKREQRDTRGRARSVGRSVERGQTGEYTSSGEAKAEVAGGGSSPPSGSSPEPRTPHPRTGWVSSEVLRWYREDGAILPLTAENIRGLSMADREDVARGLFHHFRAYGFPYPTFSDVERRKDWLALKDVPEATWAGNTVGSANLAGSKLFKHYFPHFFECSEPGPRGTVKPSMREQFDNDEMLMKVLRNRLGITFVYKGEHFPFTMTGNMLRQGFRSMRLAPPTTNFKPSVAKAIYQRYLPSGGITYDFSVGFGQRMLGFLASGKGGMYVGVDPWSKQIDASQKLLDFLGGGPVRLFRDVSERFCPADLHGQVDLAFSSPPYFTTEVYESKIADSYTSWLDNYWRNTVRNSHRMLRPGGRMVLNVAETSARHPLRADMQRVCEVEGLVFEERLGMLMPTSHMSGKATTGKAMKEEPILVFRKTC